MAQLYTKVKLYLEENSKVWDNTKVSLQDDGSGPYIKTWNFAEAQPTDEQLNAFESQANDLETLNQVLENRKAEYPSIKDLVVALYDTEDKEAIDAKRAEIKLKYPKT